MSSLEVSRIDTAPSNPLLQTSNERVPDSRHEKRILGVVYTVNGSLPMMNATRNVPISFKGKLRGAFPHDRVVIFSNGKLFNNGVIVFVLFMIDRFTHDVKGSIVMKQRLKARVLRSKRGRRVPEKSQE
jgi:hypothetical protein